MPDIDRRFLIVAALSAVLVLMIGLGIGAAVSGGSGDAQATTDTTTGASTSNSSPASDEQPAPSLASGEPVEGDATAVLVPPRTDAADIGEYGTSQARDDLVVDLALAGISGGSREDVLAAADRICYNLERLEAQKRSAAFAVRVVWNESLAELEREDLAVFSAVFASAPFYLCPASLDYSLKVAYWLGF